MQTDKTTGSKLSRLLVAAPAVAAGTIAATESHAAIVYFPATTFKTAVGGSGTFTLGNLNVTTGYNGTQTLPVINFMFSVGDTEKPALATTGNVAAVGTGGFAASLNAGTLISSASVFATGSPYLENGTNPGSWSNFTGASTQYVGIRIGTTGSYNYGWIDLGYDDPTNTMTFKGLAFEDTMNAGIQAGAGGAIPEPASAALLMSLGAAGLVAYRRRRAEALAA